MAAAHSKRAKRTYQTYLYACEHCADAFRRRKDHGRDPRFCSYTCRGAATQARTAERHAAKPAPVVRVRHTVSFTCIQCGADFHRSKGKTQRQFTCSKACQHARQRGRTLAPYQRQSHRRTCRECGTPFICKQRQVAVCRTCTTRRLHRQARATRRARLFGVAHERINPIDVFVRDRWRCQLCGCSTPKRLRGQMVDRAPELDHIVPLAVGGTHTWSNVQCACRRCNGVKAASPLGQLRLS